MGAKLHAGDRNVPNLGPVAHLKMCCTSLCIVVHTCNPNTQEDEKFEASLGYIVRTFLKKTKKSQNKNALNFHPECAPDPQPLPPHSSPSPNRDPTCLII
jgi:hypothetical protein